MFSAKKANVVFLNSISKDPFTSFQKLCTGQGSFEPQPGSPNKHFEKKSCPSKICTNRLKIFDPLASSIKPLRVVPYVIPKFHSESKPETFSSENEKKYPTPWKSLQYSHNDPRHSW